MWQQHCKTQGASIHIEYLSKVIIAGTKTAGFNIPSHLPMIIPLFLASFFFSFTTSFVNQVWWCPEKRYHRIRQGDWWTFTNRFANVHLSLACECFIPICWEMTSRVFWSSEICPRMLISVSIAHWHATRVSLTLKSNIDPPAGQTKRWNIPTLCREEIQGLRYRAIYTQMSPLSIERLFFIENTWGYPPLKGNVWMALDSLPLIIRPILNCVELCKNPFFSTMYLYLY